MPAALAAVGRVRCLDAEVQALESKIREARADTRSQSGVASQPSGTGSDLTPAQSSALIGLLEAEQRFDRLLNQARWELEPWGLRRMLAHLFPSRT